MKMINTIEILITSGPNEIYNALIIPSKNIMYLNNKKYEINDEYVNKLTRIIYLWNEEYGYDNNLDTEEFKITVTANDSISTFHGKGKYPNNYSLLKDLLKELYV